MPNPRQLGPYLANLFLLMRCPECHTKLKSVRANDHYVEYCPNHDCTWEAPIAEDESIPEQSGRAIDEELKRSS